MELTFVTKVLIHADHRAVLHIVQVFFFFFVLIIADGEKKNIPAKIRLWLNAM